MTGTVVEEPWKTYVTAFAKHFGPLLSWGAPRLFLRSSLWCCPSIASFVFPVFCPLVQYPVEWSSTMSGGVSHDRTTPVSSSWRWSAVLLACLLSCCWWCFLQTRWSSFPSTRSQAGVGGTSFRRILFFFQVLPKVSSSRNHKGRWRGRVIWTIWILR